MPVVHVQSLMPESLDLTRDLRGLVDLTGDKHRKNSAINVAVTRRKRRSIYELPSGFELVNDPSMAVRTCAREQWKAACAEPSA